MNVWIVETCQTNIRLYCLGLMIEPIQKKMTTLEFECKKKMLQFFCLPLDHYFVQIFDSFSLKRDHSGGRYLAYIYVYI